MKFNYQIGEQVHSVEIEKDDSGYRARVQGQTYEVKLVRSEQGTLSFMLGDQPMRAFIAADGNRRWVSTNGQVLILNLAVGARAQPSRSGASSAGEKIIRAPMPGQVRAVQVQTDDQVEKGQTLLLLEAMKMEIRIQAPRAGRVTRLMVKVGQTVEREQVLAEVE